MVGNMEDKSDFPLFMENEGGVFTRGVQNYKKWV